MFYGISSYMGYGVVSESDSCWFKLRWELGQTQRVCESAPNLVIILEDGVIR